MAAEQASKTAAGNVLESIRFHSFFIFIKIVRKDKKPKDYQIYYTQNFCFKKDSGTGKFSPGKRQKGNVDFCKTR